MLAATGTTSEMPGGMERLTHGFESTTVRGKVKNFLPRETVVLNASDDLTTRIFASVSDQSLYLNAVPVPEVNHAGWPEILFYSESGHHFGSGCSETYLRNAKDRTHRKQ